MAKSFATSPSMTSAVQVFPPPSRLGPHADEAQPPKPDTQFPAPLPTSFVITRMDPVGMVTNIGLDDEAVAAAEELAGQAQDYLVVLLDPLDRVCADSKWCRYTAYPVATTFRPPCPELGITPEMVLPIPPNPAVAPVRTLSRSDTDSHEEDRVEDFRFPFDDGYFWIFSSMVLRVRTRRQDGGFDDTKAIKMPMSFERRLMDLEAVLSDASFSTPSTLSFIPNFPQHPVPPDPFLYVDESAMATADQDLETKGEVVGDTCAAPEDLLQDSDWESFLENLLRTNFWGLDDDDLETIYVPLVEARLEIEEPLKNGVIGSPEMFWREQHEISLIIKDGLLRKQRAGAFASAQENTLN